MTEQRAPQRPRDAGSVAPRPNVSLLLPGDLRKRLRRKGDTSYAAQLGRHAHFDPIERRGVVTRSLLHHCYRVLFATALSPTAALAQSSSGIDSAALKRLLAAAEATHSDAVVIWRDGRLVGSWHFGKPEVPIEAMSATKSIASLAVGRAVTLGAIPSIDAPVAHYYPQWRQGQKAAITIRQLLDHTSGMQSGGSDEVETSPDVVQLALAAELSDAPGARFNYNNKAVNLLAGVVQKASGRRMDELLSSDVFSRLGFGEFEWVRDTAGTPYAYARLKIRPEDLAKIGPLCSTAAGGMDNSSSRRSGSQRACRDRSRTLT